MGAAVEASIGAPCCRRWKRRTVRKAQLAQAKSARLKDKIASLREQMRKYKALEVAVHAAPDKQISLTDPDARSMATTGKDTGLVGYNVQAVVDAQHHLIVAHEVTNIGNGRSQLSMMAKQAQEATGVCELTAIADRVLSRRNSALVYLNKPRGTIGPVLLLGHCLLNLTLSG